MGRNASGSWFGVLQGFFFFFLFDSEVDGFLNPEVVGNSRGAVEESVENHLPLGALLLYPLSLGVLK